MGRYSLGKSSGVTDRKTAKRLTGGIGGSSGSAALSSDGFTLKPSAPAPVSTPGGFTLKTPASPIIGGPTVIPDAPRVHADGNFKELARVLGGLNTNLQSAVTQGLAYATQAEKLARKEAESIADQYPEPEFPDEDDEDVDGTKSLKRLSARLDSIINDKKPDSDEYKYSESERSGAKDLLNKIGNNKRVERHFSSINNRNEVRDRALNINKLAENATVINEDGKEVPLTSIPSTSPIYKEWYRETVYGDNTLSPLEYEEVKPTLVTSRATDIKRQDKAHHAHQINSYETEKTLTLAKVGPMIANGDSAAATKDIQTLLDMLTPLLPGATKEEQALLKKGLIEGITTSFLNSDNKTKDEEALLDTIKGLFVGPAADRNIVVKKNGKVVLGDDDQPLTTVNESLRWINQPGVGGEEKIKNIIADVKNDLLDQDNKNDKFAKNEGEERANKEFKEQVLPLLQEGKVSEARKLIATLSKAYQKDAINSQPPIDADIQGEVVAHYNDLIKDYQSTDDATIADEQIQISRSLLAARTNPNLITKIEISLELMEEKYSHNKDVLKFVNTQREKLGKIKETAASPFAKEIKRKLEQLEKEFMAGAGEEDSYGGSSLDEEALMYQEKANLGREIAEQIIFDGYKNNKSFSEIFKAVQNALTRENLGLLNKNELPPEVITPTYKSIQDFEKQNKWLKGDIKNPQPNDINELTKAMDSKQPMFNYIETDAQLINLVKTKTPSKPIALMLKATGRSLSEFYIQQITKHGGTVSEELRGFLEALDKVKL